MKPHRIVAKALLGVALGATACGSPPPPEPPKPMPAPEPKPEPPPPPSCEALDEGCRAEPDTQAKIATSQHVFTPPEGWTYAQQARATVAQVADDGPVLALTVFTPEGEGEALAQQQADALQSLAEAVGIELPDKKVVFDRPDQEDEVAGLAMKYWQREEAKRGDASGSLLVLMSALGDRALLGLGYVPAADDTEADRLIFEALQTIAERGDEGGADSTDEPAPTDDGGA